jgi:citrate lyase beta subunit
MKRLQKHRALFARQYGEAAAMGFDGKTLIHPTQIVLAHP